MSGLEIKEIRRIEDNKKQVMKNFTFQFTKFKLIEKPIYV